jgi:hypothetical protein
MMQTKEAIVNAIGVKIHAKRPALPIFAMCVFDYPRRRRVGWSCRRTARSLVVRRTKLKRGVDVDA